MDCTQDPDEKIDLVQVANLAVLEEGLRVGGPAPEASGDDFQKDDLLAGVEANSIEVAEGVPVEDWDPGA